MAYQEGNRRRGREKCLVSATDMLSSSHYPSPLVGRSWPKLWPILLLATAISLFFIAQGCGNNTATIENDAGGYINAAVQAASAGDTIVVPEGIYYEQVTLKSNVTIEAAAGAQVVVDGSEPSLIGKGWEQQSDEVYYADVSWSVNYVAQDDLRLFRHSSRSALARGGYYNDTDAGRLYVRLSDGSDPNSHQMHVARRNHTFLFNGADNVTIRGIEHRYCNGNSDACIRLNRGADNNLIEGNTIHGAKYGIHIGGAEDDDGDDNNNPSIRLGSDNVIRNNTLYETGYKASDWSWDEIKGSQQEGALIYLNQSSAALIENNVLISHFDGIAVHNGSEAIISGNTISGCMDDGLELDIDTGANVRAFDNSVDGCKVGVSAAPVNTGPLYVYRNVFTNIESYAFKVGWDAGSNGPTHFYHNSVYGGRDGITTTGGSAGANIVFRNNAIQVDGSAVWVKSDFAGHLDLDYDNLHGEISWKGSDYSDVSSFQAGSGQERQGISAPNQFIAPPDDLKPSATSPNIDKGVPLPGFNDNFCGPAPDIGAFEFC